MTKASGMSDMFSGIEAFVAVAENGSFRAAASSLGVTAGAVSRAVSVLESNLDVRLLSRTTRFVGLTPEGELFLESSRTAIASIRDGRRQLELARGEASGVVCISLSPVFAGLITARLPGFRERYPGIELNLEFSDELARLADDRVDIAVRIGPLEDSGLKVRRWLTTRWVSVATREYLEKAGTPREPADLKNFACLKFRSPRGVVDWTYLDPRRHQRVESTVAPTLITNQGSQLVEAALRGLGIVQVFDFMVRSDIESGALVEVLGGYSAPGPDVFILTRHETPRVRAVLDELLRD
jgi:DNA-binding transcriptional LysR family regulator